MRIDVQVAGKEFDANEECSIVGRSSNSYATQGFWRSQGDSTALYSYALLATRPTPRQRRSRQSPSRDLRFAVADFAWGVGGDSWCDRDDGSILLDERRLGCDPRTRLWTGIRRREDS